MGTPAFDRRGIADGLAASLDGSISGGDNDPAPAVDFGPALAVADSVLYEGYLLYPYRRSSPKNQVRWQFGVLAPRRWIEAQGPQSDGLAGSAESWWNQTECLLEAPVAATVELRLRYLQLESGDEERAGAGALDTAVAREVPVSFPLRAAGGEPLEIAVEAPAGERREAVVGRLIVRAERAEARFPLWRVRVRVENSGDVGEGTRRNEALRRCLVSTHLLLGTTTGSFVSLLEPPEWARETVDQCRNIRTFPVLAGAPGSSKLVLSSPIILYDHPQVAPESPGDLFDAAEIDEILSLRTLTLTEEEKAEARVTDPRAAAIVDRVETMPAEIFARLHGAVRSIGPLPLTGTPRDEVVIGGVTVTEGSRVRLRPRTHGTDAQDMFLTGRTATVLQLLTDVDGSRFLAVGMDDDPRVALGTGPGRLLHFAPDELEPLAEGQP